MSEIRTITRRSALIALVSAIGADVDAYLQQASGSHIAIYPRPMPLRFNLRTFRSYQFTLDGRTVEVSPEEIMAALIKRDKL